MRSKLAIFVVLFGWFVFVVYIFFEYSEHSNATLKHFFDLKNPHEIFLRILIVAILIGSTVIGYLINERRKLLEKTQQSERQIRCAVEEWKTTFDSIPYGIMLVDGEFNIRRTNSFIANLLGIAIKELIDKKCYKVIHKIDAPPDGCPVVKSIKTKGPATFEYYEQHCAKYFRESVTPVFGEEGTPIAYMHLLIDITDIKEKEKKLTQSKDAFFNMLKDLDSTYNELKDIYNNLVIAFSNIIDAKSQWQKGHSERVTDYAISIAKEIGLEDKDVEILRTAALLHDIGKIGTYDVILDKPEKLTDEEFALVRKHTLKGEEILKPIKGLESIRPIIRSHHEKIDGTGYPDGLKGNEIPLLARILCVADAYDSMMSNRPYRSPRGKEYAILELKRCSGTHFDPEVVKAFLKILEGSE